VGHTHEDIDAIIGTVITALRSKNLPTFAHLEREVTSCGTWHLLLSVIFILCFAKVRNAILKKNAQLLDVKHLIGMPNYAKLFENFNAFNIEGITRAQEIRITASLDGKSVDIFYREDCTVEGWFPRPVQPDASLALHWANVFQHPDKAQGNPISFTHMPLTNERGNRQSWLYNVTFAGGATESFTLRCPSLPVQLDRDILIADLQRIERQPFSPIFFQDIAVVRHKVRTLLQLKSLTHNYGAAWEDFFLSLPQSQDDERFPLFVPSCALIKLFNSYFGEIQVTNLCNLNYSNVIRLYFRVNLVSKTN